MANRLAQYEKSSSPPLWQPAGMPNTQELQQRANALFDQATRWIVEHPEVALTTAVVTGVVFGWLIKRR